MESPQLHSQEYKFNSPEEELAYLREKVALRERELTARGAETHHDSIVSDAIKDYASVPAKSILHESAQISHRGLEALALNLAPEEHDTKMSELIDMLQEKGVKNTLSVVEHMNDAHVEDDFHRLLVQYIKKGHFDGGLSPKSELFKELSMTLYEISLPGGGEQEKEKPIKEIISAMEQFYSGMISVSDAKSYDKYIALEIANPNHSEEFIIYAAVPDDKKDLFEKQILSLFQNAKLKEVPDDYNIFNEQGVSAGSVARLSAHPVFPLKTYEQFDHDPLNVILNTFSKIKKDGEGAALQIIFRPASDAYTKKYTKVLTEIEKGVSVEEALPRTFGGEALSIFSEIFFTGSKKDEEEKKKEPKKVDESAVENIKHKLESPIIEANIRLIASAATSQETMRILADMESAFNQFHNPHGNSLEFKRLTNFKLQSLAKEFSFRTFSKSEILPLSIQEITSLFHFPGATIKSSPQLKQSRATAAAAPLDLPKSGTLLGVNTFRNVKTEVFMTKEDRLRHMYVIGQTGTGKSTLLKNMVVQDILQGEGVCMIDPHGVDIIDILANIPPERYEDVIYFDPSYTPRPMALNMLEYDRRFPRAKDIRGQRNDVDFQ